MWEEELLMAQPDQLFTRCFQAPLFDSMPFFFSPLPRPTDDEGAVHCLKSIYVFYFPNPFFPVACILFSQPSTMICDTQVSTCHLTVRQGKKRVKTGMRKRLDNVANSSACEASSNISWCLLHVSHILVLWMSVCMCILISQACCGCEMKGSAGPQESWQQLWTGGLADRKGGAMRPLQPTLLI